MWVVLSDWQWLIHLHVRFPDATTAILRLRTRKNEGGVSEIIRKCVCSSQDRILCCVCFLHSQVVWHRHRRRVFTDRFFDLDIKQSLPYLQSVTFSDEDMVPTWHVFRIGYVTDLLVSGRDLGGRHARWRVGIQCFSGLFAFPRGERPGRWSVGA